MNITIDAIVGKNVVSRPKKTMMRIETERVLAYQPYI